VSLDFLGRGIRFPFRFDPRSGGVAVSSGSPPEHAHIHESILQIIFTRIGERFMRPDFGSKLHALVFEPNDDVIDGVIRVHVVDAVRRWEKRVVITDVSFDESPESVDRHVLMVRLTYRVIETQVEGNLVFPFYREVA
jgi:hypothetical protein